MSTFKIILIGAVAASGLAVMASSAGAQESAADSSDTRQCYVTVDRSAEMNAYNVVRQEFTDGSCTCFVTTGPGSQGAAVENQIAVLFRERTCVNDPFVNIPGENPATAGGGGSTTILLAGTAGALGVAALITSLDDDAPVSP